MIISPQQLTITQLLGGETEQYVVPAYQRRYSWQHRHLAELWDDIDYLDETDTHLLGTIVCLTRSHGAGINQLEVVDGQQRLTTLCVLLQCISDRLTEEGQSDDAASLTRLLRATAPNVTPQPKLLLDSLDAADFVKQLTGQTLEEPTNQRLADAFYYFREWVKDEKTTDELRVFAHRIRNHCVVVRLDVNQAKDAFKLFETINHRGLRLSPADIIKNFVLGNAARFDASALDHGREAWARLLSALDGASIDGFFRGFLTAKRCQRVRTAEVIAGFKTLFMRRVAEAKELSDSAQYFTDEEPDEEEDLGDAVRNDDDDGEATTPEDADSSGQRIPFARFMDDLVASAKTYGKIALGATGVPAIDRRLRNLRMIRAGQAYAFLMAIRVGGCADAEFERVLALSEAVLLRRHICKRRSNENETMFAKLCGVDARAPVAAVAKVFRETTPTDAEFVAAFAQYDFGSTLDRARYCLEQFELRTHGEHKELVVGGPDAVHVEHIIPQKITTKKAKKEHGDWPDYLGPEAASKHRHNVSRIGNLTLFAGALNVGVGNNPYHRKAKAYSKSSLNITNSLPDDFGDFRLDQLEERCGKLAAMALKVWPIP